MHSLSVEIRNFILHLRLKFQLLVAPAAFLLGALFARPTANPMGIALQFFSVHVFLLGGATAFNSYYDDDKGPVEGLEHPPPMSRWMLYASLILQAIGLILAWHGGGGLAALYLGSILGFSFGYSHPWIRWKGRPILSLFVIGLFGAITPFLMGFLSAGGGALSIPTVLALLGVAFIVVAMFPVAQAHQIGEDKEKGDSTFSAHFGIQGIRRLFQCAYPLGVALISLSFYPVHPLFAWLFALMGVTSGCLLWRRVRQLSGSLAEYVSLMRLKLLAGLSLNLFLFALLVAKWIF